MRAAVRYFHSPDADLATFTPENPFDFSLLIQIMIGPVGEPGEESFDVVVCTPAWLHRKAAAEGPVIGRHHLVVAEYDWRAIRNFLTRQVEDRWAESWQELASKIGRVGRWEFEDYGP